ncbi:hypothetical protein SERLADRAFT_476197 [Serpula lacrymans var. lacrymans S7.9]|uniref:Uncharacterized protein n=1 Tax=Serpula lacrymans var. lacrymans (strain S7.9) TaxID=578457 RepID=F8P734_SERL9|nr:uncharacterized protein SERLADRAFT_476197 [Serpula lacrymans var. lacrymans S7.9]EGO21250.1 hypothetical protein SERLADRAFT_476197 [Serpula lacrymans var. lacrymans S7.9]
MAGPGLYSKVVIPVHRSPYMHHQILEIRDKTGQERKVVHGTNLRRRQRSQCATGVFLVSIFSSGISGMK